MVASCAGCESDCMYVLIMLIVNDLLHVYSTHPEKIVFMVRQVDVIVTTYKYVTAF